MSTVSKKVFCVNLKVLPDQIDLNSLPGITWGCGELYDEWTPDRLVSIDHKLNHEIYRSGYAFNNICYFRYWLKRSISDLDRVVGTNQDRIDFAEYINEGENLLNYVHFVASGGNDGSLICLKEMVEKYRDEVYFDKVVRDRQADVYITHCSENDMVVSTGMGYLPCPIFVMDHKDMATFQQNDPNFYDYEYDIGPTLVHLAAHHDNPEEIYLIGHNDLTENIVAQYKNIIEKYPLIKFYKIEAGGVFDNVIWGEMDNVEVIDSASIR